MKVAVVEETWWSPLRGPLVARPEATRLQRMVLQVFEPAHADALVLASASGDREAEPPFASLVPSAFTGPTTLISAGSTTVAMALMTGMSLVRAGHRTTLIWVEDEPADELAVAVTLAQKGSRSIALHGPRRHHRAAHPPHAANACEGARRLIEAIERGATSVVDLDAHGHSARWCIQVIGTDRAALDEGDPDSAWLAEEEASS